MLRVLPHSPKSYKKNIIKVHLSYAKVIFHPQGVGAKHQNDYVLYAYLCTNVF